MPTISIDPAKVLSMAPSSRDAYGADISCSTECLRTGATPRVPSPKQIGALHGDCFSVIAGGHTGAASCRSMLRAVRTVARVARRYGSLVSLPLIALIVLSTESCRSSNRARTIISA